MPGDVAFQIPEVHESLERKSDLSDPPPKEDEVYEAKVVSILMNNSSSGGMPNSYWELGQTRRLSEKASEEDHERLMATKPDK